MRRVWERAEASPEGAGFQILLDGRPLRAPGGAHLRVRSRAVADAIAAEWQEAGGGKGGSFEPGLQFVTRLAMTAAIQVADDREAAIAAIADAVHSDMLCYRAPGPRTLRELQDARWQWLLDWARTTKGASLTSTEGVMPFDQSDAAASALRADVAARDDDVLAVLLAVVPMLGSLVLGLAYIDGVVTPSEAMALATLDATHEAESWGEQPEFLASRTRLDRFLAVAHRYLAMTRPAS